LYWSVGNILVSKLLPLEQVSYYEISFKLFAMAEIIPIMLSSTIFPYLSRNKISLYNEAPEVYKVSVVIMNTYGVLAYLFIYCYSSYFIPLLFGIKYANISTYTSGMFLTMLIFPKSILQANLIVANKKEKTDMWLNVISLVVYITIASLGLVKFRDLSLINYSIFLSFLIFNILQAMVIQKMSWQKSIDIVITYLSLAIPILSFYYMEQVVNKIYLFPCMIVCYTLLYWIIIRKGKMNLSVLTKQSL
jgi:O-antigen/teichoic acid export membrane protein